MNDVIVRVIKLPDDVYGFTVPSPDGYMNIYLNDQLMREQQIRVLWHEIGHIYRDDFNCDMALGDVECDNK